MTNEDLPQGMTDKEIAAVVSRIRDSVNKRLPPNKRQTAKQLLAHAMSALVEHEKITLVLLKAVNVLAQQAVKDKKAAEEAGEKWE